MCKHFSGIKMNFPRYHLFQMYHLYLFTCSVIKFIDFVENKFQLIKVQFKLFAKTTFIFILKKDWLLVHKLFIAWFVEPTYNIYSTPFIRWMLYTSFSCFSVLPRFIWCSFLLPFDENIFIFVTLL